MHFLLKHDFSCPKVKVSNFVNKFFLEEYIQKISSYFINFRIPKNDLQEYNLPAKKQFSIFYVPETCFYR